MFKSKKKKLQEECWNLDYSFLLWLHKRLPIYLEGAGKIVNLEYHKFQYQGEEYTQLQLINRMIDILNYLIEEDRYYDWEQDTALKTKELLEIFSLVFGTLWW